MGRHRGAGEPLETVPKGKDSHKEKHLHKDIQGYAYGFAQRSAPAAVGEAQDECEADSAVISGMYCYAGFQPACEQYQVTCA